MKRIAILCDGTWNRSDSKTPTNVVQTAQAMELVDATGISQIPIYVQGVGTGSGVTSVSKKADQMLGGAFGLGLLENIEEAYRHLVFLYQPGDEIYIFGFSRGAYTARSLTGFIRSTGIIERHQLDRIPEAIARYRRLGDETTHPSSDESHSFRADISPRMVTSEKEATWRENQGLPEAHLLKVSYLGVWDSVGALGVPVHIPVLGRLTANKYRFHDADLSSMVSAARHAVALDETRRSFAPTRWTNIEDLNAEVRHSDELPYQERFFLGDHGSVGGGGDIRDLSSIGLSWVLEGAQQCGLAFDARRLQKIEKEHNAMGPLSNVSEPPRSFIDWLTRLRPLDRDAPASINDLHPSVIKRLAAEAKSSTHQAYQPGSLTPLTDEIAWLLEDDRSSTDQHRDVA